MKHKKELERMEQASKEGYERKINSPRRVFEWTMEDFKKTNISLVTFESDD